MVSNLFLLVVVFVVGFVLCLFLGGGLLVVGPGRAGTLIVNQAGLELLVSFRLGLTGWDCICALP